MMSTWEERMAAHADDRRQAAATATASELADPHREHHPHLQGTAVVCSCGWFMGITTVAFEDDYDSAKLACSECGAVGVVKLS